MTLERVSKLPVIAGLMLVFALFQPPSRSTAASYHLQPAHSTREIRHYDVQMAVKGELRLNAAGKKVTGLPLNVDCNIAYDERTVRPFPESCAVRIYSQAEAKILVGKSRLQRRLDERHRLVVVQVGKDSDSLFSPTESLNREEFDLINLQANSVLFPELFPRTPVGVGEKWKLADQMLARFLLIDSVSQNDVNCTLREVSRGVATVQIAGPVVGAVGGVATEIKLDATCTIDVATRQLTSLSLVVKETRSIGHAEPGFEVEARVELKSNPVDSVPALSDKSLAGISLTGNPPPLLQFGSQFAEYRLLHDSRWGLMADRPDVAIFRYVDRGDLVAQCNISKLVDRPAGQQLPLEEFQADVERSLEKNFGQFVAASQTTTDAGIRVLRVVAVGVVSELPIQWIYYHLSNDEGRRVSFVFTMEASLVERFGAADQVMAGTFEFLPRSLRTDGTPTPASAAAGNAKSAGVRR